MMHYQFVILIIALEAVVSNHGVIAKDTSTQDKINYISNYLKIRFGVVNNLRYGPVAFSAELSLTNSGNQSIDNGDWEIYFCSQRLWEPERILQSSNDGVVLGGSPLNVTHIIGCLQTIKPNDDFSHLHPGQTLEVQFKAAGWQVEKYDSMPNWYVASANTEPRTILSTVGEGLNFIEPFDNETKWKRTSDDQYNPYTPHLRYNKFVMDNFDDIPMKVIPTPVSMNLSSDSFITISSGDWLVVNDDPELETEARFLADKLKTIVIDSSNVPSNRYFHVKLEDIHLAGSPIASNESYQVMINSKTEVVEITGKGPAGVFYGIQTFYSLAANGNAIPEGRIIDYPRFPYRGQHVDVARNTVYDKRELMKLIEAMSMYKLNRLHLHLTDDEGWRLQIPGIDELTQVGGYRCHSLDERLCILSQLGSGPGVGTSGSGFFTVQEYQEILAYANTHHIQVIPEIDMPGHAHAAIKAMEARYWAKINTSPEEAEEYLLSDLNDTSTYRSVQNFNDNAINPCINSTYVFVEKVIKELVAMHKDIQPLKVFHFGGDEVARGAWKNSPKCVNFTVDGDVLDDTEELKAYFVRRVSQIAKQYDLDLAGWEDGFTSGNKTANRTTLPNDNVYSYAWNNVWELNGKSDAYILANANYKVILSHATHLYFDHPHEPDPLERGAYWACRTQSSKKVLGYTPSDVYANIDVDMMGNPITKEDVCTPLRRCVPLEDGKESNIIGMQGQLWTEKIRTSDQADYMIFPKLIALAERAWHKAKWEHKMDHQTQFDRERIEEWTEFANTLGHKEMARLDSLGVSYQLPPPGARVWSDGTLLANVMYPGLLIQYSLDESIAWSDYLPYIQLPPEVNVGLVTRSTDRRRQSRIVHIKTPPPLIPTDAPGSVQQYAASSITILVCCICTLSL